MKIYQNLLKEILEKGTKRDDRTGTGTIGLFGLKYEWDLKDGFPLLTTKRVFWRGFTEELLWMIAGDNNVEHLKEKGIHIWDEWEKEDGTIGPGYGVQWRKIPRVDFGIDLRGFNTTEVAPNGRDYFHLTRSNMRIEWVDQLKELIEGIKKDPFSRRHIVEAWNPAELEDMTLPPCHKMFQVYVRGEYLDLMLYQRSADMFLGVPFNLGEYALLLMMIAQVTGYKPGKFIHVIGDAHIYLNHIDQVKEQLSREPKPLPTVKINPSVTSLFDFKFEDITVENYNPWPTIKAPVAV